MTVLGGALGGLNAAGQPRSVTTTQDVPEWQRPYITDLFDRAKTTLNNVTSPEVQNYHAYLMGGGFDQLDRTVRGEYLRPESNPYLQGVLDIGAGRIRQSADSLFSGAGRYGSGAHQGVLGRNIGDFSTGLLNQNYQAERGRQFSATMGMPDYISGAYGAAFAPLNNYGNIVRSPVGSTMTSPNHTSVLGSAASGALGGYTLSRIFG